MPESPARRRAALLALALLLLLPAGLQAVDRVPRPQFESGYQLPGLDNPAPRGRLLEYLDVGVLLLALAAAAWLGLRARSREGLFLLGVFAVAYFGFYRKGCVCPVGALQNVALALFDPGYALPVSVLLFFLLPLATALVSGRSFCAGVCPLGAIQDLVVVRALRLPRWLAAPLGFLPVVYLTLAVLLAATGTEFLICRFDPFVSFFRLGGSSELLAYGACFLLLGTVVARPYCRFLCPYGVLLGWLSRLAFRHVTVTPDNCVQCRLCEEACPFDAIRPATAPASSALEASTAATSPAPRGSRERRALGLALLALPLLAGLGALAGRAAAPALALLHPEARLAVQVLREDAGEPGTTLESEAFRASRRRPEELQATAAAVRKRFAVATPLAGGFLAAALGLSYLGSFRRRWRSDYEPDRGECFSCGRCFSYCPREHLRRRERAERAESAQRLERAEAGAAGGRTLDP